MSVLHGAGLSPFVRKVRIAMSEKGIDYELDPVIPFNVTDEYKAMSPLGKIPCYTVRDGVHIPDSSVIIAYLERTKPTPALYPSNDEDFARALFIEEYADTAVVAGVGTVFFNRIIGPTMMGTDPDQAAIDNALNEVLPPAMTWLDNEIGSNEFAVGGAFSVADIGITSPFINLMHAGENVDAGKYPNLAKYLASMMERPSIASLIAEDREFMKGSG